MSDLLARLQDTIECGGDQEDIEEILGEVSALVRQNALLEFRLAGVKIWVGDGFMSAREAKWKATSAESSLGRALDFINGDRDNWFISGRDARGRMPAPVPPFKSESSGPFVEPTPPFEVEDGS